MTALNLLDASYYAITVLMWACLIGVAVGGIAFLWACARAREDEQRLDRTFAHPSNVTLIDRRPFDYEVDA